MLKRTFKALTNRFLRYEKRNLRKEDEAKLIVSEVLTQEIKKGKPIVFNGSKTELQPMRIRKTPATDPRLCLKLAHLSQHANALRSRSKFR